MERQHRSTLHEYSLGILFVWVRLLVFSSPLSERSTLVWFGCGWNTKYLNGGRREASR